MQLPLGLHAELGHGERVEPQQVVAPLQGLPAVAVEVEPRAARDEDLLARCPAVEHAFEKRSPTAVLVKLVEDESAADRQLASEDTLAVARHVPVEVAHTRAGKRLGERGLPDLSRPGDEDHLAPKVTQDLRREVPAADRHVWSVLVFSPQVKKTHGHFRLGEKKRGRRATGGR